MARPEASREVVTVRFIDLPLSVQNGLRRRMREAARKVGWKEGVIEMDFTYRGEEWSAWCLVTDKPRRRVKVKNLLTEAPSEP